MPRDTRHYPQLARRSRKKQFMPRGRSAHWSKRRAAALRSRRREREFVQLVPLLTQCEAMARAREVTQPSNFARAEAAEISRCRGIAGGWRLDRTLEIR